MAPDWLWPLKTCFRDQFFLGKGPREQFKGIHDIVNDQGFAMHYRAISNTVSHLEVFRCERINTAKQKDGSTSFFMSSVLETKIFQCCFLEEHKVCENNRYWSSTKRNEVAIMATKPEFLASKKDILIVLATISVVILSPGMAIKIYACVKTAPL